MAEEVAQPCGGRGRGRGAGVRGREGRGYQPQMIDRLRDKGDYAPSDNDGGATASAQADTAGMAQETLSKGV